MYVLSYNYRNKMKKRLKTTIFHILNSTKNLLEIGKKLNNFFLFSIFAWTFIKQPSHKWKKKYIYQKFMTFIYDKVEEIIFKVALSF